MDAPLVNPHDARIDMKNTVVTCDFGVCLNGAVAAQAIHGRYDKSVFPAFVTYNKRCNTSLQGFGSGRAVVVGCASANDGLLLVHMVPLMLHQLLGVESSVFNFRVRNMVGAVHLAFPINLSLLYYDLPRWLDLNTQSPLEFEPDMFPGLSFALNLPHTGGKTTVALFSTGGGVATGFKNEAQVEELRGRLCQQMRQFHLGHETLVLPAANVKLPTDALGILPPSKAADRRKQQQLAKEAQGQKRASVSSPGNTKRVLFQSMGVPGMRGRVDLYADVPDNDDEQANSEAQPRKRYSSHA